MRSIDIGPTDLETVRRLLHEHAPMLEVRAFGSRVSWTARGASDLDLALMTTEPLDIGRMAALKAAFTESDLPFRVDIVDWASTSESFRKVIECEHVLLATVVRRGASEKASLVDEWREIKLGDLIDIKHGFAFKGQLIHEETCGDVLLTPGNVAIGGGFKSDKFKYYSGSVSEEFVFREGDLFITMTDLSKQSDTLGYPAFIPARTDGRRYLHNQRLGKISIEESEKIEARYIYYVLCGTEYRNEVLSSATGTTVKHTSPDRIKQFHFFLASHSEQRAIAHILGTLDDKIELNRRMNETLEAMARALFKSWFVDFDPVRAKLEGRDTGLPNNIADLFPDQMVESELGEIPEGWEVGCLADIAVAPRRGIDPTDLRGETPYIGLEHMPRRSIALTDWEGTGKVTSNKSFFEKGEFLFGKLRPYFHKVGIAPISGVCSTDIVVIAPRSAIWSAFLLATISSVAFVNYTDQTSTGTKMPRTSWKTMGRYAMCLPTDTGARAFQKAMGPILAQTVANIHENRTLAVLRETLLPKLISGEIRARHTKAQQLIGHT